MFNFVVAKTKEKKKQTAKQTTRCNKMKLNKFANVSFLYAA